MRSVLLTGATGFLGAYLCAELLRQTTAHVTCLVRAENHPAATIRIRQRLADIGASDTATPRISAIPGNLEQDKLGLSDHDYAELVDSVDAVYHCAADVNLAAHYIDTKAVNVDGTARLIALSHAAAAAGGNAPRFHYISTLGTFSRAADTGLPQVEETSVPTADMTAGLGYALSKIEAENLVREAHLHGLPTTIHRPGVVTGDHASGTSSTSDVIVALIHALLTLRCAPLGAMAFYLDNVDTVAAGVVALSQSSNAIGQVFHHVRPDPLPLADVARAVRAVGHRLPAIPPHVWWKRVESRAGDPRILPAAVFGNLGGPTLTDHGNSPMPPVRSEQTWRALRKAGVEAPPLDPAFLNRLVAAAVPPHRETSLSTELVNSLAPTAALGDHDY